MGSWLEMLVLYLPKSRRGVKDADGLTPGDFGCNPWTFPKGAEITFEDPSAHIHLME
jgi:hypothetical protein